MDEGDTGTVNATFTVTLDAVSGQAVTVDWETSDGTATAGEDYTAGNGTLTFAPGETSKTFDVAVTGDTVDEADETFTVTLSGPSNATLSGRDGDRDDHRRRRDAGARRERRDGEGGQHRNGDATCSR